MTNMSKKRADFLRNKPVEERKINCKNLHVAFGGLKEKHGEQELKTEALRGKMQALKDKRKKLLELKQILRKIDRPKLPTPSIPRERPSPRRRPRPRLPKGKLAKVYVILRDYGFDPLVALTEWIEGINQANARIQKAEAELKTTLRQIDVDLAAIARNIPKTQEELGRAERKLERVKEDIRYIWRQIGPLDCENIGWPLKKWEARF